MALTDNLRTYQPRVYPELGDDKRYIHEELRRISVALNSVRSVMISPWQTYTPVVTAATGTLTTVSATGRYQQLGKIVYVQITITITTNGTGAAAVVATLPVSCGGGLYILSGRENVLTGSMLQGLVSGAATTIFTYNNAYPGGNGAMLHLSGIYESV